MFWRAFVPARTPDELDVFPAWYVSFDGNRFVEVRNKPVKEQESTLQAAWQAAMQGPSRRGRYRVVGMLPLMATSKELLVPVAEVIEVVP